VAGSTTARAFDAPNKTVYFDHLAGTEGAPFAHEAFTGMSPGAGGKESWVFLTNEGLVKPGMMINFQNEAGRSISERDTGELAEAGYQISVVPYDWWSQFLS
jgi:hypothetical protein